MLLRLMMKHSSHRKWKLKTQMNHSKHIKCYQKSQRTRVYCHKRTARHRIDITKCWWMSTNRQRKNCSKYQMLFKRIRTIEMLRPLGCLTIQTQEIQKITIQGLVLTSLSRLKTETWSMESCYLCRKSKLSAITQPLRIRCLSWKAKRWLWLIQWQTLVGSNMLKDYRVIISQCRSKILNMQSYLKWQRKETWSQRSIKKAMP